MKWASLNLLAGSRNWLKRDILLCRRTKVLATNLIFIRCSGVNGDPSLTRGSSTQHFSAIWIIFRDILWGKREHLTQLTPTERHLYWGWFSEDQFSNVMRCDWILIALMSLKARLYSFLYTRCPIINQADLFYKIIIVEIILCGGLIYTDRALTRAGA